MNRTRRGWSLWAQARECRTLRHYLERRYWGQHWSLTRIGSEMGVTAQRVRELMRIEGVLRRNRSAAGFLYWASHRVQSHCPGCQCRRADQAGLV